MLTKLFGFNPSVTTVRKEIVAGITTFLTMSYILAVNPTMFSQLEGMPGGAVFTSTAIAAIVGCLAMAFIGKLPFDPVCRNSTGPYHRRSAYDRAYQEHSV